MASTESYVSGSGGSSNPGDRRSSDEIRRSIERQRDELDVTTEVLQRKLAPRELAEQLWTDMRTRVSSGTGDVVGVVKRHPVPIGLIGAGIAWWLYETSSGRALSFGNGDDYEEDNLGIGSASTGSYGASSQRSGSSYASGDQASTDDDDESESEGEGWRERSMQAVQRSGERLRSGAQSARDGFSNVVDRNPLALGAACFSLGLLAAIAVPSTRWENATLGETSDRVTRRARRAAKRAVVGAAEQGARAAQEAADRVRDEARHSPSEIKRDRQRDDHDTSSEQWRDPSSSSGGGIGTSSTSWGGGSGTTGSTSGSSTGSSSGGSSTTGSSTGSSSSSGSQKPDSSKDPNRSSRG